jgi:glutamate synthase (NADPH) small chain
MLEAENIRKARRNEAWREDLRKSKLVKDRMLIKRNHMAETAPEIRNKSNVEVNKGFTEAQALVEAQRCIDCPNPTCITGCPVEISIPDFVKQIELGKFIEAAQVIKETSSLAAVCGRVCPQERQCEKECFYTIKLKQEPVAIGNLERFVADYERENSVQVVPKISKNGMKVAVVGSGPAGLSFAGDMAMRGYDVTVFEALHEIGGVLKYGIPEFRLPNNVIDHEINYLKKLGIIFETNVIVGKTITIDEMNELGFKAVFVGSGAGLPKFMNIPGENLTGVFSANEYLTRINLMGAGREGYDTPILKGKRIAIIGGGNTAMDAVRTAKRQGAEEAMIVYRRSLEEMPARLEEIRHAQEEGIIFMCLTNPVRYNADDKGKVNEMIVQKMELGAPDESGRRAFRAIPNSEYSVPVDLVIVSVGVSPNPIIQQSVKGLQISKWGTIEVNEETMESNIPMLFAGGDIVRGGATVILAMGDGKKAAKAMDEKLKK